MHQKFTKTKNLLTIAMLLVFCTFTNKVIAWDGNGTASNPWKIGDTQTNTATAVTAVLSGNTLTISGSGNMADFWYSTEGEAPWWFDTATRNTIQFVTIENGVTNIGDRAFHDCSNLASITISNSVSIIGKQAFYNCTSMYALIIPSSVTTIEDEAFNNCTGLLSIANMAISPQSINSNVFQGITVNNIYLATPQEVTTNYQSATVWNRFKFVVPYVLIDKNLNDSVDAAVVGLNGTAVYYKYQENNPKIPKRLVMYDGVTDAVKMIVEFNNDGSPYRFFCDKKVFSFENVGVNTYNITSADSNGNFNHINGINLSAPQTAEDTWLLATDWASEILDKMIKNGAIDNTTPDIIGLTDLIVGTLGVDKLMPPSVRAIYTGYMAAFSVVSTLTSCGNMIFFAATGAGLLMPNLKKRQRKLLVIFLYFVASQA